MEDNSAECQCGFKFMAAEDIAMAFSSVGVITVPDAKRVSCLKCGAQFVYMQVCGKLAKLRVPSDELYEQLTKVYEEARKEVDA